MTGNFYDKLRFNLYVAARYRKSVARDAELERRSGWKTGCTYRVALRMLRLNRVHVMMSANVTWWMHICHDECTHVMMGAHMSWWVHVCHDGCTYVRMSARTSGWVHARQDKCTYVRMSSRTSGWVYVRQDECTYVRMSARASGYVYVRQDEFTYVRMSVRTSGWVHVRQDECTYIRMSARTSGWVYVRQDECTYVRMSARTLRPRPTVHKIWWVRLLFVGGSQPVGRGGVAVRSWTTDAIVCCKLEVLERCKSTLFYISKTETWINFCEVHITCVIISVRFLLYSFNWPSRRYTLWVEKLSAAHWCWDYISLVNIYPAVNTYQLKFQLSTTNILIITVPFYIYYIAFVIVQAHDTRTT